LDRAQEAKLDLICRKLGLDTGMRLLDLGCGFGGLARYAAEKYGVRVTGLTLSRQQLEFGRELCAGLPVELRLQDYRDARGTYDRVVSVGILEHVGTRLRRRRGKSPPLRGDVSLDSLNFYDLYGNGKREIVFGTSYGMYVTQ